MSKDFISTKYTKAAVAQIGEEISKISKFTNFIIQLSTMAFYGLMIYLNHEDVFRVVLYSILVVVTLTAYICSLALLANRQDDRSTRVAQKLLRRHVLFGFKLANYAARITAVAYAFYLVIAKGGGKLELVCAIVATLLILANLMVDGILYLVHRYLAYLSIAVEADIENSKLVDTVQNVSSPWRAFSRFTERWADKREGVAERTEEGSPRTEKIRGLIGDKADSIEEEQRAQKLIKKAERKAQNRAFRAQIKANLRRIFFPKRKKKQEIEQSEEIKQIGQD